MKNNRDYYQGKIIERDSYRLPEALEIYNAGKAFNFLPAWNHEFCAKYPTEKSDILWRLRTWQEHFRYEDVPFFVTICKYGKNHALELWKEKYV